LKLSRHEDDEEERDETNRTTPTILPQGTLNNQKILSNFLKLRALRNLKQGNKLYKRQVRNEQFPRARERLHVPCTPSYE